jgi:RecA-family ATPase
MTYKDSGLVGSLDSSRGTLSTEEIIQHLTDDAARLADNPAPTTDSDEITATTLLNRKVESIPCLVEPIFQRVGLAAVAGSSDVGKSAFLRQLAFAVATGQRTFLGWLIQAIHQSAIYVSSEDDENATGFLLHSLNQTQRLDPADCSRLRFIFETHDLLAELDRRLTNAPADLVIIDAFGDLYAGDANKTNQIRQFLHDYSQLAQKHGCLILWLHHTGKRTDEEAPSKHHVIGGQGFEGKMRLLIELRRDHHDHSRRHLCVVKGNYLPDEYKNESYVLNFEQFLFSQTGERVPFEQLAKPKEHPLDIGQQRYEQIQELRKKGLKGEELAKELGWGKSYISQIEKKYGPKFSESLPD